MPDAPRAVDAHIHWFPPAYYEFLASRETEPRAELAEGRWTYLNAGRTIRAMSPEWQDLDTQFETAAGTGYDMALVTSAGVHGDLDGLPPAEAREGARIINEEWAAMQRKHAGRFYAAAVAPLVDVDAAIEEVELRDRHARAEGGQLAQLDRRRAARCATTRAVLGAHREARLPYVPSPDRLGAAGCDGRLQLPSARQHGGVSVTRRWPSCG